MQINGGTQIVIPRLVLEEVITRRYESDKALLTVHRARDAWSDATELAANR